jgi:hypothetical protein
MFVIPSDEAAAADEESRDLQFSPPGPTHCA